MSGDSAFQAALQTAAVPSADGWTHAVVFAPEDRLPAVKVAAFLREGLLAGEPAVVIATADHLADIVAECERAGADAAGAEAAGTFVTLEAESVLARFMRAGRPVATPFETVIGSLLLDLSVRASCVRVYSEMVDVLWGRGETEAALALEDLWNELLARLPARLLCVYSIEGFEGDTDTRGFQRVCSRHGFVAAAEGEDGAVLVDAGRLLAELQLRRRHITLEWERRSAVEAAEQQAREQLEAAHGRLARLQNVTSALSEAATLDDVGRVVVSEAPRALGAESLLAVPEGDRTLRLLARDGLTPETGLGYQTFSTEDHLPAAESYRTGLPVWIASAAELKQRYPRLPAAKVAALGCLPINVAGHLLGVMGFEFSTPRSFSSIDRAFMQDVARQVGCALERARLYEEARRSQTQLQQANRRKDEFLALLGHELRNPLAPIMTALQLMKLRGDTTAERERGVIERQVMHLNRLVDDLLDVSRVTQGKLQLKRAPVELGSVLAQAIELASPLIEQRAQRLTVESPRESFWVEADAARLAQAIGNLLNNAAKYTDSGGRVSVRVARESGGVVIAIRDTGVGLRPEVLHSIFQPFVQAERTLERAHGGLGLGLALVKSLVELHGGSVRAASDGIGRGSQFSIWLPLLPFAAPVSARDVVSTPKRGRAKALAVRRVLIVDDNPEAADGMAEMLGLVGHETHVAYDGVKALDKARRLDFDFAILDVSLPVMDGYEVARRLREQPRGAGVRFVAVTGFGTEEDHARSRAAGFEAHLVKPVDYDRLLQILEGVRGDEEPGVFPAPQSPRHSGGSAKRGGRSESE